MTNVKSKIIRVIAIITILSLNLGTFVYATDLNGVGQTTNEVVTETPKPVETPVQTTPELKLPALEETPADKQKETEGTAKAVGDMFNNAGVDEESVKAANDFLAPFARVLNKVMAVILGVTSLLMMLVTVLDLLYMAFPPVRDMLDGGRSGMMQQGGMAGMGGSRGMGGRYGGMGGRYGGMGGGMMGGGMMGGGMMGGMGMDGGMGGYGGRQQQQQQVGGGLSAIGRWVSDEAMAACMECQGGPTGDMQSSSPIKLMLFSYMKKRALFLILFGVCVILFTSTVFTELGIKIGMWVLRLIMGFGG